MRIKNKLGGLLAGMVLAFTASTASAGPILHVHDGSGNLGTVDVSTGTVNIIGNMGVVMTDIAFDPAGALFGLDFGNLYSINPTTAAATLIGPHSISTGNALVFRSDGTLFGAGAGTTSLFTLDINNGAGTAIGDMGFFSAGDLAFNSGNFFLASTTDELVSIDLSAGATGTAVGSFGFNDVFGLATAADGTLFGVAGTDIFSVNTSTGAGTLLSDYSGQGLGISFGSSFFTEAGATLSVPEPATLALMIIGLAGLFVGNRKNGY